MNISEKLEGLVQQISVQMVVTFPIPTVCFARSAIFRAKLVADLPKMNVQVATIQKSTFGNHLVVVMKSVRMAVIYQILLILFVLIVTLLVVLAVGLLTPNA